MQHKKLPQQNRRKYIGVRVKGTIFNATFRNISAMSWRLALLVEETGVPGKNTDQPQVTVNLYHIMLY